MKTRIGMSLAIKTSYAEFFFKQERWDISDSDFSHQTENENWFNVIKSLVNLSIIS